MNTCDRDLVWTTSHCQNQNHPKLTVQNLTLISGNSTGQTTDGGGGGAIFVRGGRLKVVNGRFFNNRCETNGPDIGGGAIRVLSQYDGQPVFITNSTFGGSPDLANRCSNGGALSSIGVSYTIYNSVLSYNQATGIGANPIRPPGAPGGGSGGAVYNDGNTFALKVYDTIIEQNHAREGGGAIFFVSNDRSGTLSITDSKLSQNPNDGFQTAGYPGIFYLGSGPPRVTRSVIE